MFDAGNSSDPDGELIAFTWDFGDGLEHRGGADAISVSHPYEKPGRYQVTLTVRDNSGSATDTDQDEILVIINDPPLAEAGEDQWITSSEVRFDGTRSADPDGKILKYLWDFGDGAQGSDASPVHVYQNPGIYTVRLTITDDSGTSTHQTFDEMIVTVNHRPISDAGPDQVGIPGQDISFDASASVDPDGDIRKFHWDFGDGATAEGMSVSHTYERSGKYNVLLTVYDNSEHEAAQSFDETVVIINASPVAVASVSCTAQEETSPTGRAVIREMKVAPGDPVHFDGTRSRDPDGNIASYLWEIADAKCTKNSGQWECTRADASSQIPHAAFQSMFSDPGIYTASLTVTDSHHVENSVHQDRVVIRVNHAPVADAGKNIHTSERSISLDASDSADADGDPLAYIWDFGDGTPKGRGGKVFHTYAEGGNYPVILTVDDGTRLKNARASASLRVKINDPPLANAGGDRTVCTGKIVIFDAGESADPEGGLMKYHWDFGDGTTDEGLNPTKIYPNGGIYPVTLTVTDDSGLTSGSTGTDQIMVKVIESPLADAGPDQEACAGTIVQFDGSGSRDLDGLVNSFQWNFGDGTVGGGPTPIHVYANAGVYRVRLMVTGDRMGDCDNTSDDEMMVTIHEAPAAEFECPRLAEVGTSVTFDAGREGGQAGADADTGSPAEGTSSRIVRWEWDFGDGTQGKGEKIGHIFAKAGSYVVTLTVTADSDADCNQTANQKRIVINAPPIAKAGEDRLVGVSQVVAFDGAASEDSDGIISSYTWDFGDGHRGKGIQARHQYQAPGEYQVTLTVTDNTQLGNNSASDTLRITVNAPPQPVFQLEKSALKIQQSTPGMHVAEPVSVCAGKEVTLSASASADADGEIVSHTWMFGDGCHAEKGETLRHTWTSPGNYTLILEVDDGRSLNNSRVQLSSTLTANAPPLPDGGPDRVVSPGEDVVFDASGSRDTDGTITAFLWDFGDGHKAEGQRVNHSFKKSGSYPVRLIVTDNSGTSCNTAESVINIRVNTPPVADAGGDRKAFAGGAHDAIVFDATASHDPDGDPLTFFWNFGDGTTASGAKVTHYYTDPGDYPVRLRVDDGTGLESGVQGNEIRVQVRSRETDRGINPPAES